MIYSKVQNKYVPVKIYKKVVRLNANYVSTTYKIFDKKIYIGYVSVKDLSNGVFVNSIQNLQPKLYNKFGYLADQIEVEHCLNRGLQNFEIISEAAFDSHALHYLRGKRFKSKDDEAKVVKIINETPQGKPYKTSQLGFLSMYMPQEIIQKYIEKSKQNPLLKKIYNLDSLLNIFNRRKT